MRDKLEERSIESRADLVDLTGVPLADLRDLGDGALAHSIRRILAESTAAPAAVVARFESSI